MPQSLACIYLHVVFSTKNRRPFLRDRNFRKGVHAHLTEVSGRLDCPVLGVDGYDDHVHMLARFGRTRSVAEWIGEVKRCATVRIKERNPDLSDFEWQGGYSVFSVSPSKVADVRRYLDGQEERHRRVSFQDELLALLRAHGMEFDEKYLWD